MKYVIRLPCTYSMVLHIIYQHTQHRFTTDQLMLISDPESHQFDSKSVEFKFFDNNVLVPSSNLLSYLLHYSV